MKNIASYAEIAFWDAAIALMSREKTPRVYSQAVAWLTLRLQPGFFLPPTEALQKKDGTRTRRLTRLGVISIGSLALGTLLGWLMSS